MTPPDSKNVSALGLRVPGPVLFVDVLPAESGETPSEVEARVRLAVEAEAPVKATEHHGSRNSVACVTLAA